MIEEQTYFEKWFYQTKPSGDCDQVHDQWEKSSAFHDYLEAVKCHEKETEILNTMRE